MTCTVSGLHMGLRGFRPDHRKGNDPDETEGRNIAHAQANGLARMQAAMARHPTRLTPRAGGV